MTTDAPDLDAELQEWLGTQEDGANLAAVARRVSGFAAGVTPAVSTDRSSPAPRASPFHSPARQKFWRVALAACLLLAGAAIGFYLNQPATRSEMAWGDVASAMQQIERFHVIAFTDDSSPNKLVHIDLYYQRPDLWRAQGMGYIQFGVGAAAKTYNVAAGKFVPPGRTVPHLIPDDLADAVKRQNLLDAVVATVFSPAHPPVATPVIDPALRESGVVIFDYGDKAAGFSARIWVLERSRLPIRLQLSEPTLGTTTWAMVDYSETHSADYFDADFFQRNVQAGGPPTEREAYDNHFVVDDVAAWYQRASVWSPPPTLLKYSENPADAPPKGFFQRYQDGQQTVWASPFNMGPVDKLPFYHANGEKVLANWCLIFAHKRTSTTGVERLIAVCDPTFKDSHLGLNLWQIGPSGDSYACLQGNFKYIDMTGICGHGEIRLFAGQADKTDASRFSIPFEARGRKGWIDGVFTNGTVNISLRKEVVE